MDTGEVRVKRREARLAGAAGRPFSCRRSGIYRPMCGVERLMCGGDGVMRGGDGVTRNDGGLLDEADAGGA